MIFEYSRKSHVRRHGPGGYVDYTSYKPWLRDEFTFRCVYCLCRERWFPNGHETFGVEHLVPKSAEFALDCDYDNLAYACSSCNSLKRAAIMRFNPCDDAIAAHLEVGDDSSVRPRHRS